MRRAVIALSLIMLVFGFSSCRQTTVIPPGILFPPEKEWSITINGIDPSDSAASQRITRENNDSYILPELTADGYEFICYFSSDGTEYSEGTVLTKNDDGLVLTAKWVTAVSVSSSESLSEAINNASGDIAIIIDEGVYTEPDGIQVKNGQLILLKGVGKESTEVKANITMSADSSLKLENMKLTADSGNLINGNSGGVDIELDNAELIPAGTARGINIEISDEESRSSGIAITMNNSSIDLSSSNGGAGSARGINVNGDPTSGPGSLASLSLDMENSTISNDTDGSIYGISIFRTLELDLNIRESSIDIQKNHYPIYIYGCGSEDTISNVNISNTHLTGYSAYYVNGDSRNINARLENCTFTCINQNTGTSSDFSILVVHNSTDCHTYADGCNFVFGPKASGNCEMHIAGTQYSDESFDKASTGGCTFNLSDCTFDYTLGSAEEGFIIAQFEVPQSDAFRFTDGGLVLDSSTRNAISSLLPGGHINNPEGEDTPYTYYGNSIKVYVYELINS